MAGRANFPSRVLARRVTALSSLKRNLEALKNGDTTSKEVKLKISAMESEISTLNKRVI